MRGAARGMTLVEIMVAVVLLGVLMTFAGPYYTRMMRRAREGATRANMHTFQLAVEAWGVDNDGWYPTEADSVRPALPKFGNEFHNPFTTLVGPGEAYEDRAALADPPTPHHGIVSYADSGGGAAYNVKGYGDGRAFTLVLEGGR